jgi:hypothetical protein
MNAVIVTLFLNEQFFSCHLKDFALRPKFKHKVNIRFAEISFLFQVSPNCMTYSNSGYGVKSQVTEEEGK